MKILYVALKYDYGEPERGLSFEHHNFYESLHFMGHDVLYFDFMGLMKAHSRQWMNRRLREIVAAEKPDLMFTVLFKDELDRDVVGRISQETDTTTVNWFCDDHWRFDNFSRFFAPSFNWVVTTAQSALPKYRQIGYDKVIKSQWACNHTSYRQLGLPLKYDVTFVGQPHGNRRRVIEALRKTGVDVRVWGQGWQTGRLSQEEMIAVFNQSRINLNLSNSSIPASDSNRVSGLRFISRALDFAPLGKAVKKGAKRLQARTAGVQEDRATEPIAYHDQIKGRSFEIPGCGGFVLSGMADNLEDYYEIGREIDCFHDVDELVEKVRRYLSAEAERAAIARAGYERTQREHTYMHRFHEIFSQIGIESKIDFAVTGAARAPGQTEDVG